MQIFEFHFNPKIKPDLIFDSFCYEPENIYEKRLGSLYMTGLLKNTLPPNLHLLNRLAKLIKERYYGLAAYSPEKSLQETLKKVNEFLEKIAKEGDVSWLGNLSFAVFSLKDSELNLTQVGDSKILLLRGNQITNISKNLELEGIEPYPLKIFGNIISGKLAEDDLILVLTKEVSEAFQKLNIINEIAKLEPFSEKKLREILNSKKEEFSKISGICLLIVLKPEVLSKRIISFGKKMPEFSFRQAFSPIVSGGKNIFSRLKIPTLPKFPQLKLKPLIKIKKPEFIEKIQLLIYKISRFRLKIATFENVKRKGILILALIFFLALGFLISNREQKRQLENYQVSLNEAQEKVSQAENFLIFKNEKEANSLFKSAWEEISPIIKIAPTLPQDFKNQVISLGNKISENLYQLNKLVKISEPELLFEFEASDFIPQKIIFSNSQLYLFSPYVQIIVEVNTQTKEKKIYSAPLDKGKGIDLATFFDDSLLFFSKPDKIIIFKDEQFIGPVSLKEPYPDFNFDNLSSYRSNLYFLDKKSGQIIKYPYLKWDSPQLWLNQTPYQNKFGTGQEPIEAKSMAVDGNIWILNKNNSINRYYIGELKETLNLELFPEPKNLSKILTSMLTGYIYLLEPEQNRVVILNKSGRIIKQFQSEKFNNLLDFAISEDGKTIWLLNGLKVYQLPITGY